MPARKSLKLSTAREIRQSLSKIANLVLNGELDPKQANALIVCCNAILSSIRIDEQEKKLAELEKILNDSKR